MNGKTLNWFFKAALYTLLLELFTEVGSEVVGSCEFALQLFHFEEGLMKLQHC